MAAQIPNTKMYSSLFAKDSSLASIKTPFFFLFFFFTKPTKGENQVAAVAAAAALLLTLH